MSVLAACATQPSQLMASAPTKVDEGIGLAQPLRTVGPKVGQSTQAAHVAQVMSICTTMQKTGESPRTEEAQVLLLKQSEDMVTPTKASDGAAAQPEPSAVPQVE